MTWVLPAVMLYFLLGILFASGFGKPILFLTWPLLLLFAVAFLISVGLLVSTIGVFLVMTTIVESIWGEDE
jgi:hypothetical protein